MILLGYKVIIYPLINELPFLNNHKDKKQWGRLEGLPAVCFGGASKTVIS
jgi:hypothetical protein